MPESECKDTGASPTTSKKRPRATQDLETQPLQRSTSTTEKFTRMSLDPIQKLRLEAIFHPKFENERSDHQIRNDMINLVLGGKGHLEVTLKHSGSLVLWSGSQRYYSKNSLSNQFTNVAEVLLRQHFERAWRNETHDGRNMYVECGTHLESERLTCAFEVVTSVLGDHGDIPNRDFLILTAVADRTTESFYSTSQLLQFAQRFRLPHNDSWAFTTPESTKQLFDLYDNLRETGLASNTVPSLSDAAEEHIASMYPHIEFQGDILEGFVIRYVPYDTESKECVRGQLRDLSQKARAILDRVPPSSPPSFEHSKLSGILMGTNIRTIFQEVDGFRRGASVSDAFALSLEKVLSKEDEGRRRTVRRLSGKVVDLPDLTKELVNENVDVETKRIAQLLQTLGGLNKAVSYTMVEEKLPMSQKRNLCVIHVLHDQTFIKFQKDKEEGEMNLFRGFCVEIGRNGSVNDQRTALVGGRKPCSKTPALMLKMKMLPYMVRTFICRNQLRVLQQDGPNAFLTTARKLMERWSISQAGKERWLTFFRYWAVYANAKMTSAQDEVRMPPLTSFSYLKHLQHFSMLYESGQATKPEEFHPAGFRGLVCVVGHDETAGEIGAKRVSDALECPSILPLSEASRRGHNQGLVCYGGVADYSNRNRDFLGDVSAYLSIVMYGCSDDEIETQMFGRPSKEVKKCKGMRRTWLKQACHTNISLRNNASAAEFDAGIQALKQAEKAAPQPGDSTARQVGLLVFFPGIPGCGKSSLLESMETELQQKFQNDTRIEKRNVKLLMGDKVGKMFWQLVKSERKKDTACVFLADKNAPPMSWNVVASICSASNGVPLPIFPDDQALVTTRVTGLKRPDGTFETTKSHFYPFSLQYLAVCLARVLKRSPSSHVGKLDSATPTAAMVVVMFYSLYRYKSAEDLREAIDAKMKANGALDTLDNINVPFFRQKEVELPAEVQEALVEALQLQIGYDVSKTKAKITDPLIQAMEEKLRLCVKKFGDNLLGEAAELSTSRKRFVDDIVDRVASLDQMEEVDAVDEKPIIKLVAVDVPQERVLRTIRDSIDANSSFLHLALGKEVSKDVWMDLAFSDERFVKKTHVTMQFWQRTTQRAMRKDFGALVGSEVAVNVKRLLWNNNVAALEVFVDEKTRDGNEVPACANEFSHITVWVADGAKASMSNRLPQDFAEGHADKLEFSAPVSLTGTLSFWDFENNPLHDSQPS